VDAARRATAAMLAEGLTPARTADALLAWHAEALELRRRETALQRPLACRNGCAHCCHLKVTLTPLEVLGVAAALRARLDPVELARFRASLESARAAVRGLTSAERARLARPCPLLDAESRCIAYEARPLSCRGANSFDADGCAAALGAGPQRPVPHDGPQLGLSSAIAEGVTYAAMEAGRDPRILELVAALHVALADDRAEERWARGEPVFEDAVDSEFVGG
jgi:hypothetical protein